MLKRRNKELDFSREESVHADAVDGLEAWCHNGKARLASTTGLWVVGALRMRRGCSKEDHPMDKSHPVDETRIDAVQRPKRQRRSSANERSRKAKASKRQTRRKAAVRSSSRVKPVATKTKQQACLDLLSRAEGATIEELQAATGWQQHSVRGFLAGAVKKKLGLTLLSEKPDVGPRRYRVSSTV